MVKKKQIGSVTRTIGAVVSGIVLSKAFENGMSIDSIEGILNVLQTIVNTTEYLSALLSIVIIQGWSFIDKHKADKNEKKLKEVENHFENLNN